MSLVTFHHRAIVLYSSRLDFNIVLKKVYRYANWSPFAAKNKLINNYLRIIKNNTLQSQNQELLTQYL